MRLGIGRTGVVILVALSIILGAEDVYVWATAGTVLGIEFFLASVFVLAVAFVAIRGARAHPPSR